MPYGVQSAAKARLARLFGLDPPDYLSPFTPTPLTPSELYGHGPNQNYVSDEGDTGYLFQRLTPDQRRFNTGQTLIQGGIDTANVGFMPPYSAKEPPGPPTPLSATPYFDPWLTPISYDRGRAKPKTQSTLSKVLFGHGQSGGFGRSRSVRQPPGIPQTRDTTRNYNSSRNYYPSYKRGVDVEKDLNRQDERIARERETAINRKRGPGGGGSGAFIPAPPHHNPEDFIPTARIPKGTGGVTPSIPSSGGSGSFLPKRAPTPLPTRRRFGGY